MPRQRSLVYSSFPRLRIRLQDVEAIFKVIQRHWKERGQPEVWSQLLQFRLLSCPMIRRDSIDMHERAEETDLALSKNGTMSWAERQRKSLEIRRFVQLMSSTMVFQLAFTSPRFSRMFEAFRGQDAYGVAVHMDKTHFHVFLVGTPKKMEYFSLPSCEIEGRVSDLVRQMTAVKWGVPQDNDTSHGARKVHMSKLESSSESSIEGDVTQLLRVLWEVLVHPIVQALQLQRSGSRRKRLIWCPVGLLTILPLHAAGVFEGPVALQDNISNYAVSSYTPTFTAFCRAINQHSRATVSKGGPKSVLIIADQAKSCTYARLPHIAAEADIVRSYVAPECIVEFDGDTPITCVNFATRTTPHVELLHFACHGKQESSDPFQSGLELRGGRLTLDQLTRVAFPNGRLAYLSACETASFDPSCPDNGMNLATTFLFNGFRSVIGSMW